MALLPDVRAAILKIHSNRDAANPLHATLAHFLSDGQRCCTHSHHGLRPTIAALLADLPFNLSALSSITARGGRVLISTSEDDTTNPPGSEYHMMIELPLTCCQHTVVP